MSGAAEWAAALGGPPRRFTLRLSRLGLEAECRALTTAEVGECLAMGGDRGARYALWLSCEALREAGESLRKSGQLLSPFDLTEALPYADALAAAGAVLRQSGAVRPMVEEEGADEADGGAEDWLATVPAAFLPAGAAEAPAAPPEPVAETRAGVWDPDGAFSVEAERAEMQRPAERRGETPLWRAAERDPRAADADGLAALLLDRLRDAAGNM